MILASISEKQENGKTDTSTPNMSFSWATFESENYDNPTELLKSQLSAETPKLKNCPED